jgi:hypothetical protein
MNTIFLDEQRKSEDKTDLDADHFAKLAAATWSMKDQYTFWGALGFHEFLLYAIGAGQTKAQINSAISFFEKWRGTPEMTQIMTAVMRLQLYADKLRDQQLSLEKHKAAQSVKIQAVTSKNAGSLTFSPPPNTTKAQRRSPHRVRLVSDNEQV